MFRMQMITVAVLLSGIGVVSVVGADNRSEFEKWMQQETQSYQEYRDKRDKEFTSFLKTQWKEMQTFQGLVRDKTPKPVNMPVAPKPRPEPVKAPEPVKPPVKKPPTIVKTPEPDRPAPDKPPVKMPEPVKPPVVTPPVVKPPVPIVKVPPIKPVPEPVKVRPAPVVKVPQGKTLNVNFFGQNLRFSYDPKLKVRLALRIDEKAMSNYWSELSKADYEPLLKQINAQRKPLGLNDWGYALLANRVAQGINPGSRSEQSLLTWFILTKAGYKARIAYDSRQVYLLLPSRQQLFAAPYFTFDNVRYYALGFDGKKQKPGRVFTYDGHYPGANKRLDMSLTQAVNTGRSEREKLLSFKYRGKTYRVRVGYDQQTVDYLTTYPQMDIGMYFSSRVNQATGNPLLAQLKPLVEGKSEQDAVNLLLRFVQTAFKYKTDEQQFGIENYLFPEETLHYPYSDCEDRSVFFAWLVHSLLGLEVVGLDFPGHIAAAVQFNENVRGDAITFNKKRYVVTDPTYINANAGMTMPEYKNKRPGVIRILF